MTSLPAITHFALTVSDLDRSMAWYERLFEAPPFFVGDEITNRFAVWVEPMFALHQHRAGIDVTAFDEHRIGLDHVAFGCPNRQGLETWLARLDKLCIEHEAIVDAFYGSGLASRDPDHIQLEFFANSQ